MFPFCHIQIGLIYHDTNITILSVTRGLVKKGKEKVMKAVNQPSDIITSQVLMISG